MCASLARRPPKGGLLDVFAIGLTAVALPLPTPRGAQEENMHALDFVRVSLTRQQLWHGGVLLKKRIRLTYASNARKFRKPPANVR